MVKSIAGDNLAAVLNQNLMNISIQKLSSFITYLTNGLFKYYVLKTSDVKDNQKEIFS